jgi:hypothetical protein
MRHSADCRWVLGDSSTHNVPRDRLCPACQAEVGSTTDISSRRNSWEKQIQEFHNLTMADVKTMESFVNKNAYEVLFGRSEARLKGIVPDLRRLLRVTAEVSRLSDSAQAQDKVEEEENGLTLPTSEPPRRRPRSEKTPLMASKHTLTQQRDMHQETLPNRKVDEPSGSWSTYVNDNGSVTEASGKFRYDPITMRLVPDEPSVPSSPDSTISDQQYPRRVDVEQPSAVAFAAIPIPPTSTTTPCTARDLSGVKEKLEQSYIEAGRSVPTRTREINRTTTKSASSDTLASAWRKEQSSLQQAAGKENKSRLHTGTDLPKPVADAATSEAKSSLESAWNADKSQRQKPSSNPHYIGGPSSHRSHEAQMTYMSLLTKDKPLRHMRGYELGTHRANLLASWRAKAEQQTSMTDLNEKEKLNKEVLQQKTAFTAFEDKWRLRASAAADGVTPPTLPTKPKPSDRDDEAKLLQQQAADSLVRDVREIYEESYGVIDENHRQGAITKVSVVEKPALSTSEFSSTSRVEPGLGSALDDYESKNGGYAFSKISATAKAYEEEVKNRGVSDAMWDAMDPSLSRVRDSGPTSSETTAPASAYDDYEAKIGGYSFVPGQDNLDKELKHRGVSDAMWTNTDPELMRMRDVVSDPAIKTFPIAHAEPLAPSAEAGNTASSVKAEPTRSTSPRTPMSVYRLLAYDPQTQTISSATTTSSKPPSDAETSLSATEALSRLAEPAKFVKHLSTFSDEDYEIVSAQKDLLVLKLVEPGQVGVKKSGAASVLSDMSVGRPMTNPVDGTMRSAPMVEESLEPSVVTLEGVAPTSSPARPEEPMEESSTTRSTFSRETASPIKISAPVNSSQASRTMRRTEAVYSGDRLRSCIHPWTPSEVHRLLDLHQQGKKVNIISSMTGRTAKEVKDLIDLAKDAYSTSDAGIAHWLNTLQSVSAEAIAKREITREKRKRVAEVKSIAPGQEATLGSTALMREASRYPSSFLHSTRTYFPPQTLAARTTSDDGGPTSGGSSSAGRDPFSQRRRGPIRRVAFLALLTTTGCYFIGVLSEQVREYREDSAASRRSPPDTSSAAAARNGTSTKSDKDKVPTPSLHVRAASGGDQNGRERAQNTAQIASPVPAAPAPISTAASTTLPAVVASSANPAAAGFDAEDGGEMYEVETLAAARPSVRAVEGEVWRPEEKLGAIEGAFALGAGIAAAVCVLFGGFGSS